MKPLTLMKPLRKSPSVTYEAVLLMKTAALDALQNYIFPDRNENVNVNDNGYVNERENENDNENGFINKMRGRMRFAARARRRVTAG